MTNECQLCGEKYEVNARLQDGCCDGCREEENRFDFEYDKRLAQAAEPDALKMIAFHASHGLDQKVVG